MILNAFSYLRFPLDNEIADPKFQVQYPINYPALF